MAAQSTNHILLIEPAEFFSNLETIDTNHFQKINQEEEKDKIFRKALDEFRTFEQTLRDNHIHVTTLKGQTGCPDNIFPNWAVTFENKTMHLFSMMAENRRLEKLEDHIDFLNRVYQTTTDLTEFEKQGIFLEGTSSMVLDRVNKVAYMGLSPRSDEKIACRWAEENDYEIIIFETQGHIGKPIYHTDVLMFIGTDVAVISTNTIKKEYQSTVKNKLSQMHSIIEITRAQILNFCGNCMEVKGDNNELNLVMSTRAYNSYSGTQKQLLLEHYDKIIHSNITTIENYGGGSARCMMMELF